MKYGERRARIERAFEDFRRNIMAEISAYEWELGTRARDQRVAAAQTCLPPVVTSGDSEVTKADLDRIVAVMSGAGLEP